MAGFTCSLLELDILGDALHVDVRPFPFDIPHHGETVDERRRFAELVERNLTDMGIFNDAGLDPEFSQSVVLFAQGELSIAMLGTAGDRSYLARASTDGQHAVVAVRENEQVRFEPLSPTGLVRAVVGLLPPMKPGPGSSISITVDEPAPVKPRIRRNDEDEYGQQGWMEKARPANDTKGAQHAAVEAILRRPRVGAGYFNVSARGRNGLEGEPLTVNWLDTDAGRYMIVPSRGEDGRTHVAYSPADQVRIDQVLTRHLQAFE